MSLGDRGLPGEQYAELACGTENVSPYSSSAGYTDPPSYYQTDYNWQHAHQPQQQQSTSQPPHLHDTDRHYYPGLADGNETNAHAYITYGHHPVNHPEFYSPAHNIWPTDASGDHLSPEHINPHHRFFSGVDRSQQCLVQQLNTSPGSISKPKRRRVQSHTQRKAANVRERRRMFHLNEAFDELRKRLPAFNYEKRLSRIETLRLAMTYISFMKEVSVGRDPKCIKLKPHGADFSPQPHDSSSRAVSPSYYSDKDNDDGNMNDDSDCSNDEVSNQSGVI